LGEDRFQVDCWGNIHLDRNCAWNFSWPRLWIRGLISKNSLRLRDPPAASNTYFILSYSGWHQRTVPHIIWWHFPRSARSVLSSSVHICWCMVYGVRLPTVCCWTFFNFKFPPWTSRFWQVCSSWPELILA
jgi:hypothetical protein